MTTDKTYNGWTNYETWNVALWMDNDQGSQEYWQERAEEIAKVAEDKHEATNALAEEMKDQHEEASQDLLERANAQCSVWADLLGAALSEVCWYEIAGGKLEDVEIGEPAE